MCACTSSSPRASFFPSFCTTLSLHTKLSRFRSSSTMRTCGRCGCWPHHAQPNGLGSLTWFEYRPNSSESKPSCASHGRHHADQTMVTHHTRRILLTRTCLRHTTHAASSSHPRACATPHKPHPPQPHAPVSHHTHHTHRILLTPTCLCHTTHTASSSHARACATPHTPHPPHTHVPVPHSHHTRRILLRTHVPAPHHTRAASSSPAGSCDTVATARTRAHLGRRRCDGSRQGLSTKNHSDDRQTHREMHVTKSATSGCTSIVITQLHAGRGGGGEILKWQSRLFQGSATT